MTLTGMTTPSQTESRLVVAGICGFIAYGRFVVKPL
jgi:hypothetical protein